MTQLHTWARSLPEPRAILIVSAHWGSTPLFDTLGAATDPEVPVTTAIEGYATGLSKRSFQAA